MSDLSNLFHFFSSFGGNDIAEKIKEMESTYGNKDGVLTKSELQKAIESNKAMLEVYGWNGEYNGNDDDLVTEWFKKMDTIKTNHNIKGTGYTETGAISLDEIEILNNKAAEENFFNENGEWVDDDFFGNDVDYAKALKIKELLVKVNMYVNQADSEVLEKLPCFENIKSVIGKDFDMADFVNGVYNDIEANFEAIQNAVADFIKEKKHIQLYTAK